MNELAPGSMSLEEENPSLESLAQPVETPPAPETPAQTPQSATPEPENDPEGTVVNPGGEKLVPLSALAAKRQEASTAKAALAEKDAKIAELEQKAAQLDKIKGDWNAVQPLIQRLQHQPPPDQAPPKPAGPLSPQDAVEYAKDLDLYKADGTPDVDRAQRLAARQQTLAQQTAQQMVQPLYQNTAQQQSRANFEAIAGFTDKQGVKVDRAILQNVWSMLPAELTAQEGVARVLYKIAKSETMDAGLYKQPAAPPPPPQFTESLGGNTTAPKELSQMDRAMMTAGNIKTKDYESISSNFKPGQTNALE